jgi:hypothetical protein
MKMVSTNYPALRFMLRVHGKAGPKFTGQKGLRRQHGYTVFPWSWEHKLMLARHRATFALALYILRRDFETNREPFKVSNVAAAQYGVDRKRKNDALRELEALGLIYVQWRSRKTPIVRLRQRA